MAAKSRAKAAQPRVLPSDWEAVVRQALLAVPGVKATELKKALPAPYQKLAKEALATAKELAARGEVHAFPREKPAHFFPNDPLLELDEILRASLARSPLSEGELKARAGRHAVALKEWLKRAVAEKRLYAHTVTEAGKKKTVYGTTPDVRKALAPLLKALAAALQKTAAQGISNEQVASVLLEELGVKGPVASARIEGDRSSPVPGGKRGDFLGALSRMASERPREALLPVGDLRARLALTKDDFDALALELMRERVISLHHHDHPASLTEAERAQMVRDARGTFYIGIAARSGA